MLHSEYMSENVTEELEEIEVGTTHCGLSCTLTPTYTGSPVTARMENPSSYPLVQSQAVSGSANMNRWVLRVGTVYIMTSGLSQVSGLRMDIDLTPIKDSLGYNPNGLVTLSVDDHNGSIGAFYEVTGRLSGTKLTFDVDCGGQIRNGMSPLDFGSDSICDACRQRTAEYANPMRMVLTQ